MVDLTLVEVITSGEPGPANSGIPSAGTCVLAVIISAPVETRSVEAPDELRVSSVDAGVVLTDGGVKDERKDTLGAKVKGVVAPTTLDSTGGTVDTPAPGIGATVSVEGILPQTEVATVSVTVVKGGPVKRFDLPEKMEGTLVHIEHMRLTGLVHASRSHPRFHCLGF